MILCDSEADADHLCLVSELKLAGIDCFQQTEERNCKVSQAVRNFDIWISIVGLPIDL